MGSASIKPAKPEAERLLDALDAMWEGSVLTIIRSGAVNF
jgi:hypothetical protein